MARFKLDDRKFKRRMNKISEHIAENLGKATLRDFRKNTPRNSGYARKNTRFKKLRDGWEIRGDYPYSGVLDRGLYPNPPKKGTGKTSNGYSKKAPQGMVIPTLKDLTKRIKRYLRRS